MGWLTPFLTQIPMNEITKKVEVIESPITLASNHYQMMVEFVKLQMVENVDFGVVPGTNNKPVLLKPGAEKLCRLFNLYPQLELIQSIVDFDKPLFHYHYRCTIYRQGEPIGQGEGCCNSKEKKYEKQQFKVYDLVNTITKIAQKRAMVSAVLVAVGASQFFTQDILEEDISLIDQTTAELKRLGWTNEQGRFFLQKHYGKNSRQQLTQRELQDFLEALRSHEGSKAATTPSSPNPQLAG